MFNLLMIPNKEELFSYTEPRMQKALSSAFRNNFETF